MALLHVLRHPTVVPSEWWRSAVPMVGIVCGGARTNDQGTCRKSGSRMGQSLASDGCERRGHVGLQDCEAAGLGQRWELNVCSAGEGRGQGV